MDERSGTRKDSHANHYDLTDNNTVGYDDAGVQGRAASFVAANQERLTIPDTANLSGGNIDFTLIANVYLNNNTGTFVVMDKSDNANAYDYRISHNPGTGFRFRVGAGSAYVDSGAVSANAWHTVIAWHDSVNNTINIQVDNGTVNTLPYSSGTADSTQPLSIGAFPSGSNALDGRIDEVAVYRRVLTASERAWIYNNGVRRTYADLTAPPPGSAIDYDYDDPDHIHAVTALSSGESYSYDANGNMSSRTEGGSTYTQTFDIHNRLATVTVGGQTTQFLYDPDGNLVTKVNPDGSKTIYVGGIYEEDKSSSGTVTGTRTYYPAGGAMRVGSTLYYVLKDHLGSASVVTDATVNAAIVGEDRFYPFGETRFTTGTMLTDKLFTGQLEITGLGIYHYGARFYSPKLGRFLSADTITPNPANPQNLNRYSYVRNNPLRFNDPTGHMVTAGDGGGGSSCNLFASDCTPTGGGGGGSCNTLASCLGGDGEGGGSGNEGCSTLASCFEGGGSGGGGGSQPELSLGLQSTVTCGAGYYSPHCPGWHFYTTTTVVCPAELHCTAEEMMDYFLRFAYPGQNPANTVTSGNSYVVGYPFMNLPMQLGWGDIVVDIGDGGFKSTNTTKPSHILYDGQVVRHLSQREDGSWQVSTYGYGNNVIHTLPGQLGQFSFASINQSQGLAIFQDLDRNMLAYILEHH